MIIRIAGKIVSYRVHAAPAHAGVGGENVKSSSGCLIVFPSINLSINGSLSCLDGSRNHPVPSMDSHPFSSHDWIMRGAFTRAQCTRGKLLVHIFRFGNFHLSLPPTKTTSASAGTSSRPERKTRQASIDF